MEGNRTRIHVHGLAIEGAGVHARVWDANTNPIDYFVDFGESLGLDETVLLAAAEVFIILSVLEEAEAQHSRITLTRQVEFCTGSSMLPNMGKALVQDLDLVEWTAALRMRFAGIRVVKDIDPEVPDKGSEQRKLSTPHQSRALYEANCRCIGEVYVTEPFFDAFRDVIEEQGGASDRHPWDRMLLAFRSEDLITVPRRFAPEITKLHQAQYPDATSTKIVVHPTRQLVFVFGLHNDSWQTAFIQRQPQNWIDKIYAQVANVS